MSVEKLEDFDGLLESSLKTIKEGEIVSGKILKVAGRNVFLDIGAKAEGVCKVDEFKNPRELKKGYETAVYVEDLDGADGFAVVSKHKADFTLAWDKIKSVYDTKETIGGKVLKKVKGGLIVDIMGVDAFLPGSHIDLKLVKNFLTWVGKEVSVKILKLNKSRKNLVVSRKEALLEELEKKKKELKEKFTEGEVVEGVVKNLTSFGAFVNVKGIDGLVHLSDLSQRHIKHPREVVKVGDKIKVKVIGVDPKNFKLSLSLKDLLSEVWEKIDEKYPIGSRVTGRVKKILNSGILAELEPEIVGFVHLTEMTWKKSLKNPREIVSIGDAVECIVLDIDKTKGRISLGMKQTQPDPWSLVDEKYRVGDVVKGKVIAFDNLGAFVSIGEGIEGYLHVADISWTRRFHSPDEALRTGQRLRLKITEIDRKNRFISLSLKHLRPNPWVELEKRLRPDTVLKAPVLEPTRKGVVVEIDRGLEGFVPLSHLLRKGNPQENYKSGNELNLKVLKVEPQRKRILLSEKDYERTMEKKEMEKFMKKTGEPMRITLGEVLKDELDQLFNVGEEDAAV